VAAWALMSLPALKLRLPPAWICVPTSWLAVWLSRLLAFQFRLWLLAVPVSRFAH
jgi:hypothetical protein